MKATPVLGLAELLQIATDHADSVDALLTAAVIEGVTPELDAQILLADKRSIYISALIRSLTSKQRQTDMLNESGKTLRELFTSEFKKSGFDA